MYLNISDVNDTAQTPRRKKHDNDGLQLLWEFLGVLLCSALCIGQWKCGFAYVSIEEGKCFIYNGMDPH